MARPRILVVQPSLQPPGGGNGVCAWILQALRDDYDLTVLAWDPIALDDVNRFFGTSLRPGDFTVDYPPRTLRKALDLAPLPLSTAKFSILRRHCKQVAPGFDLMMGAHNEADFGRRGIQYVHYPVRHVPPLPVNLRWYHWRTALTLYEGAWSLISPFDDEVMRSNLTLVNSAWTGRLVASTHGIPVRVVPPPAAGAFVQTPWDDREEGFLCIGRLSPEKNIETAMEIVRRVRLQRPAAHLHVIGRNDKPDYVRRLTAKVREAGPWVTLDGTLPIEQLERMLSTHRFLIHAMQEEHFGMAVAQALRAGCIPIVPDGGGQVEIVGPEPALRYHSVDDAVEKILRLMEDRTLQREVRARLAARAERFSPERFMEHIRAAVTEVL